MGKKIVVPCLDVIMITVFPGNIWWKTIPVSSEVRFCWTQGTWLLGRDYWAWRKQNAEVCSNHFKLGKPVDSHPHPTFFLEGYSREIVTGKRKAPVDRLPVPSIRIRKKKSCTDSKQREKKETMNIVHTTKKPAGYGFSLYYLSGKRRSLLHPILTRHNDLFSHYNLILVKR